ncbi:MAG: HAD family hydrolase [Cyanobacteria bacterium SZAS LIN-3]|nr:HAD family hydrolase [Cyanobacteria bacterium SZAS LIN-3]
MDDTNVNVPAAAQKKPLLILDMDETLLFGVDLEDDDKAKRIPLPGVAVDFQIDTVLYYKRPHLDEFLRRMWKVYDLAVWSFAGATFVEGATAQFMTGHPTPLFVWNGKRSSHKTVFEPYYQRVRVKNLKHVWKLGFDKNRTLIVEDSPEKCILNYGNAVYIKEFVGDQGDEELLHLAAYLETLVHEPSFRKVEKRHWREKF